jgi:hypothetical protein
MSEIPIQIARHRRTLRHHTRVGTPDCYKSALKVAKSHGNVVFAEDEC